MEGRHWKDGEIVAHYYGVAAPGGVHRLEECATCAALWHAFETRRQAVLTTPPVPRERLADIRSGFERKRDGRIWGRWYWMPAIAAALCVAVAVIQVPRTPKPSDAPAIEEILAEASKIEPDAVSAAQFLFAEEPK